MAFDGQQLTCQSYGNGFTLWQYYSGDDDASNLPEDYFSAGSCMLRTGDMILASRTHYPPSAGIYFVTGANATAVRLSGVTAPMLPTAVAAE